MAKNITNTPPSWAPNAVPSDKGWRHPVTGELLVSVRGGVKLLNEVLPEVAVLPEITAEKVIDENIAPVEVLQDEPQTIEPEIIAEENKKKGRKKNAK